MVRRCYRNQIFITNVMAFVTRGKGNVADALSWAGTGGPNLNPGPTADDRQKLQPYLDAAATRPRAAGDSLDHFRGVPAAPVFGELPRVGPADAGAEPREFTVQLAQVQARLGSLEQENASLRRSIEQRDNELRKAVGGEQMLRALSRQMQEIDETLRRASRAHEAMSRRVRAVEDAVGFGTDSGGAHAARIRALEESWREGQQHNQDLEAKVAKAAAETARLGDLTNTSINDTREKLLQRIETGTKGTDAQLREIQEGRRKLEEGLRTMLAQLTEDTNRRFAEVHGDLVPAMDRGLREQLAELGRVIQNSATQTAEDLAGTQAESKRGQQTLRRDLRELQSVVQKGLLSLRAESEKQGKALASIIKEEISTRTLNAEATNKQIQEIRLQLDADMSSNGTELANVQGQLQSQLEINANNIGAMREQLEALRGLSEGGSMDLRAELSAVIDDRHTSCMETIKSYGLATEQELRQVANRIVKEEMARSEADSDERKIVEQLRNQVTVSIQHWHTAMDRFDQQHLSLQKRREQAEQELRAELRTDISAATDSINSVDRMLREVVDGTRDELHAKLDQTAQACHNKLAEQRQDLELALEQSSTAINSRTDVVEASLEREATTLKTEMGSVAGELTMLQDETKQTLLGFREYMDTELESIGTQQVEMREEIKGTIEVSYDESKQDTEFAVSNLDSRLREHVEEEIGNLSSTIDDNHKVLRKQLQQESSMLAKELESCTALKSEVHRLRIRVTHGEEAVARSHNRTNDTLQELREELDQWSQRSEATSAGLAQLMEQTSATVEESSEKLSALDKGAEEYRQTVAEIVEGHKQNSETLQTAEQSLRVNTTRIDERVGRVYGRLVDVEAKFDGVRIHINEATAALDAQMRSLLEEYAAEHEPTFENRLQAMEEILTTLTMTSDTASQKTKRLASVMAENLKKQSDKFDSLYEEISVAGPVTNALRQQLTTDMQRGLEPQLAELRDTTIHEMQAQLSASVSAAATGLEESVHVAMGQIVEVRDDLDQVKAIIADATEGDI